jgi:hypothetical protein
VKRLCLVLLLAALWLMPLQSATMGRLSMDDLITKSTSIVRGKVTGSWAAYTGSIIYTHYKIQVSENFKGAAQSFVEVMVPGGTVNTTHQNFSGSPMLQNDQEYVLFLWTSNTGITWITGLTQGLFSMSPQTGADAVATRPASRELMLDAVTSQAVKDTAYSVKLSELRRRIPATLAAQGGAK